MSVVGQQNFSPRMGLEWICLFFKARPIDCEMARLATIHSRHRLIEAIAIELVE